jgi:hypothetical protein
MHAAGSSTPVAQDKRADIGTGRPRHEAATAISVARNHGVDLTARSSRTRAASPSSFPDDEAATPYGAPEQQSRRAAQFPER